MTNATVSESKPTRKPIWRSFGARLTPFSDLPGPDLLARWRLTHLHTGARLWTETDRDLAAEVEARCYGVAQLSRLQDLRCPRWVEELCFRESAKGRRMSRPWWARILAMGITAFREGAEFLELDYYEGAAELNTSPKTWQRMVHEMREAGLLVWERAYREIADGTRYRDPSNNLYRLGPALMQHREALLEGTKQPGKPKLREWNARTLRAAARLARRDREVEHRQAARRVRDRWTMEHGSPPTSPSPSPSPSPSSTSAGKAQLEAPAEEQPERVDQRPPQAPAAGDGPGVAQQREAQGPGRARHPFRVSRADGRGQSPRNVGPGRVSRSEPLTVNVASLPAPGARGSASPSPEPRAQTANQHPHAQTPPLGGDRRPELERNPRCTASPAAGFGLLAECGALILARLGVPAAAHNAGPSHRANTVADPRLEVERRGRGGEAVGDVVELLEPGVEVEGRVLLAADEQRGLAEVEGGVGGASRKPEIEAALEAVRASFARRGSVCSVCSGLGSLFTGRQSDGPQRCGACDGSGK